MISAHDILDIELKEADSDTVKVNLIKKSYKQKQANLKIQQERQLIDARRYAQQQSSLQKAYDELMLRYATKFFVTNKNNLYTIYAVDPDIDVNSFLREYTNFVENNYKDHPLKEKFKPEQFHFSSFEQFKGSDFYKDMPEELKSKYTRNNDYPKKIIVFKFTSMNDMLKFCQGAEMKKIVRQGFTAKLRNKLRQDNLIDESNNDIRPSSSLRPGRSN